MKISKFYSAFSATAFVAIALVVSCNKTYNTTLGNDTTGASDNCLAETTSDDVTMIAAQVSENISNTFHATYNGSILKPLLDSESLSSTFRGTPPVIVTNSFVTITHDTVHKLITALFNGTACADGHVRTGKLTFNYSQSLYGANYFRDPGFKMSVSDSAYTDNGNAVTILLKYITNTTPVGFNPAATTETWTVIDTITIIKKGGSTITMNSTKTKTLVNTNIVYHGKAVPISWDSANVELTGSSTGVDSEGETYSSTITSPLARDFTCIPLFPTYPAYHPIISGTTTFVPGTKAARYINYGYPNNGACDQLVSVSIYNVVYPITLP